MTPATPSTLFAAGWLLAPDGELCAGGGIEVVNGRIVALVRTRAAAKRSTSRRVDLGPGLLAPAFVDAHAHLELSGLGGSTPRGGSFADWIRAVIGARADRANRTARAGSIVDDARRGAERLLATGTTLVGDIDSTGAIESAIAGLPLCVRRYREVLDAGDPARTSAALDRLSSSSPGGPGGPGGHPPARKRRANLFEGISPHAPYTVSRGLWDALAKRCRASRAHVAIHWAETREETEWLEHARGPLAAILQHSPRERGLDAIARSGLLGARTALIHGNEASADERERVARSGTSLVHCPGTHAFFAREPFDAAGWLATGVNLALGTDSVASNDDLDMGRETALFARANPKLPPRAVLECATARGARALGLADRTGRLAPGMRADFLVYEALGAGSAGGEALLAALVHAEGRLAAVFSAGRRVAGERVVENGRPASESSAAGPQ